MIEFLSRGEEMPFLHPSPAAHLAMGVTLSLRERYGTADSLPFSSDAAVFPECGKQGNANQDACQTDETSGNNRVAVG